MNSTLDIRHSTLDWVGPVLESGETAEALIAAMRELEPALAVRDHGSYLRVLAPGRCVLRRALVERVLGRTFRLPGDLEAVMPSFKGAFTVSADDAVWAFAEKSPGRGARGQAPDRSTRGQG